MKLIGATSHYVSADLDEGPIIGQDTIRVTHAHLPWSVFLNGNKIVVFPRSPGSFASERMG